MTSTDIVLQKITNGDFKRLSFSPGFEHISIKYTSTNRVEIWVNLSTSLSVFSSSYAQYLITSRLPTKGVTKDQYFNLSMTKDIPDCVLEDNLKQIIEAVQKNIKQYEYSIEITL